VGDRAGVATWHNRRRAFVQISGGWCRRTIVLDQMIVHTFVFRSSRNNPAPTRHGSCGRPYRWGRGRFRRHRS
jgi:hypothetical protein